MRLLVTRPAHKARELCRRLTDMGHQVVTAPMLDIHFLPLAPLDPGQFDALLFTSANGVDAMANAGAVADFARAPVFCVGRATAAEARDAGFARVSSAAGDGSALAMLIIEQLEPGRLLHVRGCHGLAEPAATLAQAGFDCVPVTGYEARACTALDDRVAGALKAGELDGVLLYSPRSAAILSRLTEQIGLTAPFAVAFCLSPAISAAAAPLAARRRSAATPDEEALLELVGVWGRAGPG